MAVIPVPERIRLKIKSQIKELIYTNLNMKDFVGDLAVQNQEVVLSGLKTNILGGTFAMEGLYDTKDIEKPNYAVKLDLSKFKYAEAIKSFDMLKKAAPIAEYLDGIFNTTLVMKGKLGSQMMPDLSTLDASGFIETVNGSLKGFNPFGQLADKLGVKELANVTMANTKNWFEIINGTIELKEFNKVISGVDLTMGGRHGFGKDMDYNIDLVIPRSLLKKNNVTNVAESGLGLLEKEAGKLGININQGPNLFVNVKMTGNIKSPKFKITPKTSAGASASDAVTAGVNSAVAQVKDTINKEIKKQEEKLRDTIQKRANEELEKVKTKVATEGQKVVDTLKAKAKTEVINRVDSLTKGVISDSLKQKAKDVLDKKTGDEVDKIKDKLKDFNPFKKKGKG
jgi:AsmA-like C-terminal region